MWIEAITLREIRMRLKAPFETSFGSIWERRILLVEAHSEGLSGWGEVTAGEGPFYNSETTDTGWHIIREFLVPRVLGQSLERTSDVEALFTPIRGHEMAKAAVENAIWDLESQVKGISLSSLLGGTHDQIPCGVSIGIQDSIPKLLDKITTELRAGYQRVKIKIKPGVDLDQVAAIRKEYPDIPLMVDANSAYRLTDADRLRKFDDFNLMMIEQPLDWDDIYQHSLLQNQMRTPICLDESIHTAHHAEAAIRIGACRVINIKLGRVSGHSGARRVHDVCRHNSVPVWCGGMLESGIGRAHNIAMSTLPGFVLPGDVSASRRYWEEDIIEPEVEVSARGTIQVPVTPGLGYSVCRGRIDRLTARQETWTAQTTVVAAPQV